MHLCARNSIEVKIMYQEKTMIIHVHRHNKHTANPKPALADNIIIYAIIHTGLYDIDSQKLRVPVQCSVTGTRETGNTPVKELTNP